MSYKVRDTVTALLFLAVLLTGVVYLGMGWHGRGFVPGEGFSHAAKPLAQDQRTHRFKPNPAPSARGEAVTAAQLAAWANETTGAVETELTDLLDRDRAFIESYGLVQSLIGRRVMEDVDPQYTVVRLSDGSLTFANPDAVYTDPSSHGQAVAQLRDALDTMDIPLLYVQAPQKVYYREQAALPDGMSNYGDAHTNALLYALDQAGVDYLDLRPVLAETGRYSELFFRTDHHWTPEGAFIGWQALAETLEEDYGFSIQERSVDPQEWTTVTYEDVFLGSQGKRVGTLYAGTDDFTVWYPSFYTRFAYEVPIQGYDRKGSFQRSLLFPERLEETDLYQSNPYTYYSGGDYPFARMKNLRDPDGPTVVLLRDSFGCAFAPYLALECGELVTIDLRHFNDHLMTYITWVEADMVILLYSPMSVPLDSAFDFFSAPGQASTPGRKPLEVVTGLEKPAPGAYGDAHVPAPSNREPEETAQTAAPLPGEDDSSQLASSRNFTIHPLEKRNQLV